MRLAPDTERWRRTWELSAVVIVYDVFFTHYYYLTMLIVPLTVLMVRATGRSAPGVWAFSHCCSAFLLLLSL